MLKSRVYYLLILLFALVIGAGCSVINGDTQSSTFTIKVDSINVPSEVASDDTLTVRPFGTVGPNGCYSFERFESSRTSSSLDLKLVGELTEGDDIGCFDAIVQLDTVFKVPPPLEGSFEINIQQPDESVLSRTVEVKD
ncbi:hypothetical protein [Fodinibius salsisoli]|uniref:Immunoglobulin-like domain of spore germination n=1 Tax=Fodinibius salsisoli TaxID=2820877 RepID=A0ABT3PQA2_9BACT|nr:hypothetical protein [Fodinibius salsisoli]MCW9708031.1 hypothetical protein [Fodinibius salsisoli]